MQSESRGPKRLTGVGVGVVEVLGSGQALDTAVAVAGALVGGTLDLGQVGDLVKLREIESALKKLVTSPPE